MIKQMTTPLERVQLKFASDAGAGAGVGAGADADSTQTGVFSGYASVFGNVDLHKDRIMPGAFEKALAGGAAVDMYFNHDSWGLPIGKWLSLAEDEVGLKAEGELTEGMALAADVRAAMRHQTVRGLSVGFVPEKYEKNEHGGLDFHEIQELVEISVVTRPANPLAAVAGMKSIGAWTLRDCERVLRDSAQLSKSQAQALIARIRQLCAAGEAGEPSACVVAAVAHRIQNIALQE